MARLAHNSWSMLPFPWSVGGGGGRGGCGGHGHGRESGLSVRACVWRCVSEVVFHPQPPGHRSSRECLAAPEEGPVGGSCRTGVPH